MVQTGQEEDISRLLRLLGFYFMYLRVTTEKITGFFAQSLWSKI